MKAGARTWLAGGFLGICIGGILLLGRLAGGGGNVDSRQETAPGAGVPEVYSPDVALAATVVEPLGRPQRGEREGVGMVRRQDGGVRPGRRGQVLEPVADGPGESLRVRTGVAALPAALPGLETGGALDVPEPEAGGASAPFGRILKCELVFTLESSNEESPIVGLLAEDQWWDGRLVLPAGTEVHGQARMDRFRDRVFSGEDWVLVIPAAEGLRHGRELRLRGMVLDRDQLDGDGLVWSLTDGSRGLRGTVVRTTDPEELKALAFAFLSAAAGSAQQTSVSAFGARIPDRSPANVALAGAQGALDLLAGRMLEEVKKTGSYLRVPAGKQFYLYVLETLRPPATRLRAAEGDPLRPRNSEPAPPP